MYNQTSKALDGFRVRYAVLFLAGDLLIQIYHVIKAPENPSLTLLVTLIGLVYYFALTLFLVISIGVSIYKLRWRRALSMLLAPVLVCGLLWGQFHTGFTPDYIHFLLVRSSYLDQVRQAGGGERSFHAWLWERIWGVGVTATQTVLIYDGTDQLLLSPEMRSMDWVGEALKFDGKGFYLGGIIELTPYSKGLGAPSITKFGGHFYLVEMAL